MHTINKSVKNKNSEMQGVRIQLNIVMVEMLVVKPHAPIRMDRYYLNGKKGNTLIGIKW